MLIFRNGKKGGKSGYEFGSRFGFDGFIRMSKKRLLFWKI